MSFLPEHIQIPRFDGQEIPIGMFNLVPVGLKRDKDGELWLDTTRGSQSIREEDETPERINQLIDKFIDFVLRSRLKGRGK